MSKRVSLELDLPDELADQFRDEDVATKAKEARVMELLRELFPRKTLSNRLGSTRHSLMFQILGALPRQSLQTTMRILEPAVV